MELGSGIVGFLTVLVVKPAVIVLLVRLVLRLRRSLAAPGELTFTPPEHRGARLLLASLALFLASELTCGVEIFILASPSGFWSGVHGILSAASMGGCAVGLYALLDGRLLGFGERRCLGNRYCHGCALLEGRACMFRGVMLLLLAFLAVAALVALLVPTHRLPADVSRYALPIEALNRWYDAQVVPWLIRNVSSYRPGGNTYFAPEGMLIVELRVIPLLALAGLVPVLAGLLGRQEARALEGLLLVAGVLAYVYFEALVYVATADPILGSLVHEVAELWFVITLGVLLRRAWASAPPPEIFTPVEGGSP